MIDIPKSRQSAAILLSLTIVFVAIISAASRSALSDEPSNDPVPISDNSTEPSQKDAPDAGEQSSPNAQPSSDANNETGAADNPDDSDESTNSAEILYSIRRSYDENDEEQKQLDNFIQSQSSAYVYRSHNKPQDSIDNVLDNWLLSSFEDSLYLSVIIPSFITISPVTVDLDPDILRLASINSADLPIISSAQKPLNVIYYTNFPIPESVMKLLRENSDEFVNTNISEFTTETTSSINYVVLLTGLLGFAILGYIIYRVIVWRFMLDQPNNYENRANDNDKEFVVPVTMDAYSAYLYQTNGDNNEE